MEHSLLTPRNIILKKDGIPFDHVVPLLKNGRFHDRNISGCFGDDSDLNEINRMEQNLGQLTPDLMDRRVAADFCCLWRYDYPERVFQICEIIGGNNHMALRLHYQVSPQRRNYFIDYAKALQGWLNDVSPEDTRYYGQTTAQTVNKVYGFLGQKDPLKMILAERAYISFSSRFLNCSFWGKNNPENEVDLSPSTAQPLTHEHFRKCRDLETKIKTEMGRSARNFLVEAGGSAEPACHFKFIRRVDILISSIGCLKWRGNLPPKDENITGRKKLTATILNILENYWRNGQLKADCDVSTRIYRLLGKPNDSKKWLVACLWKNIKDQTETHAYPMKEWAAFVRIGERYLDTLNKTV